MCTLHTSIYAHSSIQMNASEFSLVECHFIIHKHCHTHTHTLLDNISHFPIESGKKINRKHKQDAMLRLPQIVHTLFLYNIIDCWASLKPTNGLNIILGSKRESLSEQAIDFPIPNRICYIYGCGVISLEYTYTHSLTHTSKWCVRKISEYELLLFCGSFIRKKTREKNWRKKHWPTKKNCLELLQMNRTNALFSRVNIFFCSIDIFTLSTEMDFIIYIYFVSFRYGIFLNIHFQMIFSDKHKYFCSHFEFGVCWNLDFCWIFIRQNSHYTHIFFSFLFV